MIHALDNFILVNPAKYREDALALEYQTHVFPEATFHGIATGGRSGEVAEKIVDMLADATPTLTFFRKSPQGQVEPHFIHTDVDMGQWSAILYLNPETAKGDGTTFWTHRETGEIGHTIPHLRSDEGRTPDAWDQRLIVPAQFNRLLIFPSWWYHSRNIFENYGEGDESRLTQVTFGVYE